MELGGSTMWKWEVEQPRAVIVIVHGAGEHHGRYKWLAKKWNELGCNVIMGDLPGQGKTRGKRGHIQSFSQYVDTVVSWYNESMKYDVPIFLLGHSMGGLVTIRTVLSTRIHVQGIILSSPCLGLANPPSKSKQLLAKTFHRITPQMLAKSGGDSRYGTRNEEIREAYVKDELRVTKVSLRWYQELQKAIRKSMEEAESFPNIPLLVLQAGEDYIVSKYAVQKWFDSISIQEKTYKEWEGLYHEVFNEPERGDVFLYASQFVNLHL